MVVRNKELTFGTKSSFFKIKIRRTNYMNKVNLEERLLSPADSITNAKINYWFRVDSRRSNLMSIDRSLSFISRIERGSAIMF